MTEEQIGEKLHVWLSCGCNSCWQNLATVLLASIHAMKGSGPKDPVNLARFIVESRVDMSKLGKSTLMPVVQIGETRSPWLLGPVSSVAEAVAATTEIAKSMDRGKAH